MGIQVWSEGPCPFPRGYTISVLEKYWKHRTTFEKPRANLTKLGTKHHWLKGSMMDYDQFKGKIILKIQIWKFIETLAEFLRHLAQSILWWRRLPFVQMERWWRLLTNFLKLFFYCQMVSQASNVVHGSLVYILMNRTRPILIKLVSYM